MMEIQTMEMDVPLLDLLSLDGNEMEDQIALLIYAMKYEVTELDLILILLTETMEILTTMTDEVLREILNLIGNDLEGIQHM